MNLQDFTKLIMEQFLEEDQPDVTSEIDFRTLPTWDSLTGMAVLTTIQDEFDITIPVNDFKEMNSIEELFNYATSQKGNK